LKKKKKKKKKKSEHNDLAEILRELVSKRGFYSAFLMPESSGLSFRLF